MQERKDPRDLSEPVGYSYLAVNGGTYYLNPSTGITTNIITEAEMETLHDAGLSVYFFPSDNGIDIYTSLSDLSVADPELTLYRSIAIDELTTLTSFQITISPNPATTNFTINVSNYTGTISGSIELYQANNGGLVLSQNFNESVTTVNRPDVQNGNYFCLIYIDGQLRKSVPIILQ